MQPLDPENPYTQEIEANNGGCGCGCGCACSDYSQVNSGSSSSAGGQTVSHELTTAPFC